MTKTYLVILISTLVTLFAAHTVNAADDVLSKKVSISGFATIGAVKGGDDLLGFRRNWTRDGVFDSDWSLEQDSLFGIQLDTKVSPKISATVQLVGRDRASNSLENSIEWAYLNYQFNDEWAFRFGRTGVDLFSLSDYRNVGFAYLWARPPVDFYGPVAFDSVDGIDLTRSKVLTNSYFQFKLFAGQADTHFASDISDDEVVAIKPIIGATASWEFDHWRSRIGLATVNTDSQTQSVQLLIDPLLMVPATIWPEASSIANDLNFKDRDFHYYSFGLTYDKDPWLLESELGYIDSGYAFYPSVVNAYLSLGYRKKDVTIFGMLSHAENTEDSVQITPPRNPPIKPGPTEPIYALFQGAQYLSDVGGTDQTTYSLGLRWDVRENVAFKFQWDHHKVGAFGSALWSQQTALTQDRTLNTFSVNLSLLF